METPLSCSSSRPRFRHTRRARLLGTLWAAGAFLFTCVSLGAFPPNPSYTIYGMVRDQVGATLRVDGAVLVLLANGTEVGRTAVRPESLGDLNYELDIRIDQSRPTTRVYSTKALPSHGLYSLYVELNGERFYPIEGKVYAIAESADLRTWTLAAISTLPSAASGAPYYRATASGLLRGYVATAPGASRFYRLTVR